MNHPTPREGSMTGTAGRPRCRRFWVTGRVQGVFFRESAKNMAQQLGLTGHAKNLEDGSVEVLACGSPESLQKLSEWLGSGPPQASVTGVASAEADVAVPDSFTAG